MIDYGLGAIPSPSDPRDFPISLDLAAPLPRRFLSNLMPPVLNQHTTPKCVCYTSAGVKSFEERRDGRVTFLRFDPDWLYPRAQAIDGVSGSHDGTTIRAALRVLKGTGMARISSIDSPGKYKIAAYYSVPMTEDAIKRAVMQHGVVLVGSVWYNSWFRPKAGILPDPSGGIAGGHARYIFGWDDDVAGGSAIVRNSWGSSWGVNGNSYDPWRGLIPALHDAWRATDVLGD